MFNLFKKKQPVATDLVKDVIKPILPSAFYNTVNERHDIVAPTQKIKSAWGEFPGFELMSDPEFIAAINEENRRESIDAFPAKLAELAALSAKCDALAKSLWGNDAYLFVDAYDRKLTVCCDQGDGLGTKTLLATDSVIEIDFISKD